MTDVYFHYTPSQIAFAALSLADKELMERLINKTFRAQENGGNTASETNGKSKSRKNEADIIGAEVKAKILASIGACSEMLATELPEKNAEYWGQVSHRHSYHKRPLTQRPGGIPQHHQAAGKETAEMPRS